MLGSAASSTSTFMAIAPKQPPPGFWATFRRLAQNCSLGGECLCALARERGPCPSRRAAPVLLSCTLLW
jgi:hypothetical protein